MNATSRAFSSLLLILVSSMSVDARADESLHLGRNLAATCTGCHGATGKTPAGVVIPPLAGEPKDFIIRRISEFRAGTRPATVMQEIAKGYTDEQVAHIATWFAAQK